MATADDDDFNSRTYINVSDNEMTVMDFELNDVILVDTAAMEREMRFVARDTARAVPANDPKADAETNRPENANQPYASI